MLLARDRLLLILAFLADIRDEVRDVGGIVSAGYQNAYGFVPRRYKKNNFYMAVKRSLETGYIEKIVKDGRPFFRLTSKGEDKVRDFSIFRLQGKSWDGKWRLVIFDIEEVSRGIRDGLRVKLKELGFGMLQQSCYISPFDVGQDLAEFLEAQNLKKTALLMEVKKLWIEDEKALAYRVWRLEEIEKEYEKILEKWQEKEDFASDEEKEDFIRKLKVSYLNILEKDPCLPKELLPKDWPGFQARNLIKRL